MKSYGRVVPFMLNQAISNYLVAETLSTILTASPKKQIPLGTGTTMVAARFDKDIRSKFHLLIQQDFLSSPQ